MNRIITLSIPLFAMFPACRESDTRDVGEFSAVENQTDAKTAFFDLDEARPPKDRVVVVCEGGGEADVVTTVNSDGTLVISGTAGADCTVEIRSGHVDSLVVTGNGDVDVQGTWHGLAHVELRGSSLVHIDAVDSDSLDIDSRGSAVLTIDVLQCGGLDLDLGGTSDTTLVGHVDRAEIAITGNAVLDASDCAMEEAVIDASGNATVDANVLGEVTSSVTGSAIVNL
jgi:hypothetical protein